MNLISLSLDIAAHSNFSLSSFITIRRHKSQFEFEEYKYFDLGRT